jgi:hypothetical protein
METMKKGSVIFPRASRAQLVDNLSTTLNRKQSIMINIAQNNDTTPVELDKLFTQEEQKALEERGFLGTPAPYLDTAETILPRKPTLEEWVAHAQPEPKPALIHRKSIDEMLREMINEQIDKRVEEKVAAIMQSHATIALISQEQRDMMRAFVDEHEANHDHDGFCTREQAEEIAEEAIIETNIENAVKRTINNSNIVEDIVDSRIDDIDWEEKVREGLGNILG